MHIRDIRRARENSGKLDTAHEFLNHPVVRGSLDIAGTAAGPGVQLATLKAKYALNRADGIVDKVKEKQEARNLERAAEERRESDAETCEQIVERLQATMSAMQEEITAAGEASLQGSTVAPNLTSPSPSKTDALLQPTP